MSSRSINNDKIKFKSLNSKNVMPHKRGNDYEPYFRIGKTLEKLLSEESKKIRPGDKLIDICERIENRIIDQGLFPAFPVNISINEIAAHYTAPPDDLTEIPENSLVKLDVGIRDKGYIVDAARTLVFNDGLKKLADAALSCLDAAKRVMKPGINLQVVGQTIYDEAKRLGFKTIANLSGHKIGRYKLHAGVGVPNVPVPVDYKLKVGDIFAVEPFLTFSEAPGMAKPSKEAYIFSFRKKIRSLNKIQEKIILLAENRFKKLPFAERWLIKPLGRRVKEELTFLAKKGALISYPVLIEAKGGIVSQEEDTFLITEDGALPLTRA
ncbi:MAG: type II methionyl aminopeptidase [Thermoproteota archaeon]|nr:MAG: type II methionyl aminopeptidase [Candidatus Korarchaeota archaeon]